MSRKTVYCLLLTVPLFLAGFLKHSFFSQYQCMQCIRGFDDNELLQIHVLHCITFIRCEVKVYGYSSSQSNLPHRYMNSHAI